MKHKKLVYYFFIISISLILFLPLLNLSFIYKNNKLNLQSFSKQQLFSTDNLESIINYVVYKSFNVSMNPPQVIAGKDHFLFLGNSHGNILDKTKGTLPYSNKDIDKWTDKLKKLQDWYEAQGIEFIMAVVPNKHTVYSDKLPDGIVYKEGKTITDDIVKSALQKDIHILNLKKALREQKQTKQLFFYTDTHWNNYGAHIGYINTVAYLNKIYNQNYEIAQYDMQEITPSGDGDLTNLLKINQLLSNKYEKEYRLLFKEKRQLCYGKINKKYELEKCSSVNKNMFNQYAINENPPNQQKVLYLCDSFGLANSQLYMETFNTVWRLHLDYIYGSALVDFVKENKPDVVIYQIVERKLNTNYIVADLPKILKSSI